MKMNQPRPRWLLITLLLAFHAESFAAGGGGENSEAERHLQRLVMHHVLYAGGLSGVFGMARACARHVDPGSPDGGPMTADTDPGDMKQQPVDTRQAQGDAMNASDPATATRPRR
ncbi:MAG TPA: hypothetical protein ENN42_09615 [Thioalkalivibrio sp.]|nr:hypothetical protein [Thioalkalivibrio sp.]